MSDGWWLLFMITGAALMVSAMVAVGVGLDYYKSCQRAEIFNRMSHTEWTCSDFFWAGDQINNQTVTVRP